MEASGGDGSKPGSVTEGEGTHKSRISINANLTPDFKDKEEKIIFNHWEFINTIKFGITMSRVAVL